MICSVYYISPQGVYTAIEYVQGPASICSSMPPAPICSSYNIPPSVLILILRGCMLPAVICTMYYISPLVPIQTIGMYTLYDEMY